MFGKPQPQPTSEALYCPENPCLLRDLHFLHLSHSKEGSATLAIQLPCQAKESYKGQSGNLLESWFCPQVKWFSYCILKNEKTISTSQKSSITTSSDVVHHWTHHEVPIFAPWRYCTLSEHTYSFIALCVFYCLNSSNLLSEL